MTDRPNKVTAEGEILPLSDDEFAAYLEQLANPPVVQVPVPSSITNYQARATLIADGNFTAIDSIVRNSGNLTAIAAWDYANVFERGSPFIALLKSASPYNTDALVDDLFVRGNKVT